MKKRILILTLMLTLFACLFAISLNAETVLKTQDNNAYGELSLFDESISVGRTNTKNGFTPYFDAEGTTYARVVVGDGTTFYTFPTAYILSEGTVYGTSGHNIFVPDLTSLNSAMETATGSNPGWTTGNIYRIEMPYTVNRLNGGGQNFSSFEKVVEITLQPNSQVQDANKNMIFWNCYELEAINNLDTFVFRNGCLGGAFQNCRKLTSLTIGVSSEVTTTSDNAFYGCTSLKSVNLKEAFPNLTAVGKNCFYQCTNLVSTSSEEGIVSLPNGVTQIGYQNNGNAFYECKAMKYLSLPTSLKHVGATAFYNCTALEFVDFNDNQNDIEFYNYGHFMNCTALKAVSLSDNITVLNNRIFNNCTALQAVYLPADLKEMGTNGNGQGPFCYSKNMYFVQEPFEVRDENGRFLGDSFVMPTKPEVYYMPSNLATASGNVSSGTWFRDCIGLNTTIVMPTAFTNSTVVQMFRETASASNIKNVVYLGDMENIAWSERNHHINFIFANVNDKDISSITFSSFYNNLNNDCYFYFCSTGYRYTMAAADATAVAETKVENSYNHILSPRLTKTTSEATCIKNAIETQYCFCTIKIYEGEVEGTATGIHIYDDDFNCATSDKCISDTDCLEKTEILVHKVIETLVYGSYLEGGIYNSCCENAGCNVDKIVDLATNAIFIAGADKGYSTNGTGIAFGGYSINLDALKEFNRVNENAPLTFGIMLVNPNYLDGKTHFMQNGIINTDGGALQVEMSNTEYSNISIMVNGFTGNAADLSLVIALYAYTDADDVEFIQSADTKCASAKVTKTDGVLYTVNYKSVSEGVSDISNLGDYIMPSQKENI